MDPSDRPLPPNRADGEDPVKVPGRLKSKETHDRPEWRKRKPRVGKKGADRKASDLEAARAGARARAKAIAAAVGQALLAEPLPAFDDLGEESLRVLRSIANNPLAEDKDRVAAAKAIREATAPDIREHILKLMKGDKAKYKEWLRSELEAMGATAEGAK